MLAKIYGKSYFFIFYGVCSRCIAANKVFDDMLLRDVVSWSGYIRRKSINDAVILSWKWMSSWILQPLLVFVACGCLGYVNMGMGILGLILKHAFEKDLVIINALLDVYVKWVYLWVAKQLLMELRERDVISWTSMISGLVQCKSPNESLELFNTMLMSVVELIRSFLPAYSQLVHVCKYIHQACLIIEVTELIDFDTDWLMRV